MFDRLQHFGHLNNNSCFLWGPRQVGKSTLLKQKFPEALYFNLLDPILFEQFQKNPARLKDILLAKTNFKGPVILDEVQKIPSLLDLVQLLIDEHQIQFILCGSSARKLKRGAGNLLGGRAIRYELFPLVSQEIPQFDLHRALNHGLLPRHYLTDSPRDLIHAYVGDYLKEEIAAEGLTRNIQAFARFLEVAAISNGEMINYKNIASECGVESTTVKDYFQILADTLIGQYVPSFTLRPKRRVIKAPKFYFFDVGLINFLLKRGEVIPGAETFGRAFEHLIYQEMAAHRHYSRLHYDVSYWRTSSDLEVDFILGQHEVALEIKGTRDVQKRHLKGLLAFQEEYKVKKAVVVSLENRPRLVEGSASQKIEIIPWKTFLENLWNQEYLR